MKKRLAIFLLGFVILTATAWAVPDGVWKNSPPPGPAYSFYIQTYVGNAMLVIVAPNTEVFWVFLDADDDYTNGFSANQDLSGAANKLTIAFTSDDAATASLTFVGELPATYALARNAQAPASPVIHNPPTGSLTSPTNGATVSGSVAISGTASDDVGLDHVGISINGAAQVDANLNTGTGAFSYAWNTTLVSDGGYTIVVTAYDTEGLSAVIGNISVTVDNNVSPPVGNAPNLISPANGETIPVPSGGDPYNMTWTAVVGAVSYIIQLCTDSNCNFVISGDESGDWTESGTILLLTYATPGFDYYWRVRADLGGGSYSPWSVIWLFHVSSAMPSDRNLKENFGEVRSGDLLAKLKDLPVSTWIYRQDASKTRHMGPMAQDFHAAFGLGDDRTIFPLDANGVAFVAIQQMNRKLEAQSARLRELEKANEEMRMTLNLLLTREAKISRK